MAAASVVLADAAEIAACPVGENLVRPGFPIYPAYWARLARVAREAPSVGFAGAAAYPADWSRVRP